MKTTNVHLWCDVQLSADSSHVVSYFGQCAEDSLPTQDPDVWPNEVIIRNDDPLYLDWYTTWNGDKLEYIRPYKADDVPVEPVGE